MARLKDLQSFGSRVQTWTIGLDNEWRRIAYCAFRPSRPSLAPPPFAETSTVPEMPPKPAARKPAAPADGQPAPALPTLDRTLVSVDWILAKNRGSKHSTRQQSYERRWGWTAAFWVWILIIHTIGILLFTNGFLLTRLVLDDQSACGAPPVDLAGFDDGLWDGHGTIDGGCWHPKSFKKAVVILIDALRYDFTVPAPSSDEPKGYENALTFLHETAVESPQNAFLRPFIADPPTTTLQRLKGLTTGTLPTFIDIGASFSGTTIEEDNLLGQLRKEGKKIVHLGDDTWWALFPDYFEANESQAFESFNVWDLHTLDNGVLERIFPLMEPNKTGSWDLLVGHFLGVDHAGHRYGPDHPAMNAKLTQMDVFLRRITSMIDDDTLLVVMGDHGMDVKGDHGGESDDEIEAALWMYSKQPFFGRTSPEFAVPPENAKIRPVNQIDLVPTLALLLGIPIPFNNLGRPIEEAFAGLDGASWPNLATASRVTAAGIRRYQDAYFKARGIDQDVSASSPITAWDAAESSLKAGSGAKDIYDAFTSYQEENLRVCKDLWASFDATKMITGLVTMALSVITLLLHISRMGSRPTTDHSPNPNIVLHKRVVLYASSGMTLGTAAGAALYASQPSSMDPLYVAAASAIGSIAGAMLCLVSSGKVLLDLAPSSIWGWLSVVFTVSQSAGFAANSFTIWEDSISLFFLSTFGLVAAAMSFRLQDPVARDTSLAHSIIFVVLARLASQSKFCREEQMPYCTSTYYASVTSSTSSITQLFIPFVSTVFLPPIVLSYMKKTQSDAGWGEKWVSNAFRGLLSICGAYWVLDAADNGDWFSSLPETLLKRTSVYVAIAILAAVFIAGPLIFTYGGPLVSWVPKVASDGTKRTFVSGYDNALGSRYLMLPVTFLTALVLLSKPMGGGALSMMLWQVLCLVEIIRAHDIAAEPIGPVVLALLGNFHYFTTGHQAVLSTIQWDSAFIPLFRMKLPWSAIIVTLNTFAGQILATVSLPLIMMWLASPDTRGLLEGVSRSMAAFTSYFAVESLATMAWAGHLRRHLMLYRVFNPRFMMAAALLLVVDVVGILVTLTGVRLNTKAVNDVFGYPD